MSSFSDTSSIRSAASSPPSLHRDLRGVELRLELCTSDSAEMDALVLSAILLVADPTEWVEHSVDVDGEVDILTESGWDVRGRESPGSEAGFELDEEDTRLSRWADELEQTRERAQREGGYGNLEAAELDVSPESDEWIVPPFDLDDGSSPRHSLRTRLPPYSQYLSD